MRVVEATVRNEVGLHARPATVLIQKANEFKSSISLEVGVHSINAKSLLGVLSLGVAKDQIVKIIANGSDEDLAAETLQKVIDNSFSDE
ncbi:MAG: HPr family phosphocarrier protein [Oscillospiraceae bacterium]|nr:HPr family phosphocarrier protein [Oscillospiraceae bacterium]